MWSYIIQLLWISITRNWSAEMATGWRCGVDAFRKWNIKRVTIVNNKLACQNWWVHRPIGVKICFEHHNSHGVQRLHEVLWQRCSSSEVSYMPMVCRAALSAAMFGWSRFEDNFRVHLFRKTSLGIHHELCCVSWNLASYCLVDWFFLRKRLYNCQVTEDQIRYFFFYSSMWYTGSVLRKKVNTIPADALTPGIITRFSVGLASFAFFCFHLY